MSRESRRTAPLTTGAAAYGSLLSQGRRLGFHLSIDPAYCIRSCGLLATPRSGRFGGASLSGSLGANAALPDASPPPELWAASSTAKAAEIPIAKFRRPLRGDYRTLELDGQIRPRRVGPLSSLSAKNISLRRLLDAALLIPAVPPRLKRGVSRSSRTWSAGCGGRGRCC